MARRISFIRHGKAVPAAQGQNDIDRLLSEVGQKQATARREKLDGTTFDLVLSSPAPRAYDTGVIVSGRQKSEIVVIDELYPDPNDNGLGQQIDVLFNLPELGYKPVADYLAKAGGKAVTDWGYDAWALVEQEASGTEGHVAVFGHAVCLPAIGMAVCFGSDALVNHIADLNLGECEGFTIVFDNGTPVSVETIR